MIFYFRMHFCYSKQSSCSDFVQNFFDWALSHHCCISLASPLCIALDIFSISMWKIFMPCLMLSGAHHSSQTCMMIWSLSWSAQCALPAASPFLCCLQVCQKRSLSPLLSLIKLLNTTGPQQQTLVVLHLFLADRASPLTNWFVHIFFF